MNPLCKITTGALPIHEGEDFGNVTTAEVMSKPISFADAAGSGRLSTPQGGCQLGEALQPHRLAITSRSAQRPSIRWSNKMLSEFWDMLVTQTVGQQGSLDGSCAFRGSLQQGRCELEQDDALHGSHLYTSRRYVSAVENVLLRMCCGC